MIVSAIDAETDGISIEQVPADGCDGVLLVVNSIFPRKGILHDDLILLAVIPSDGAGECALVIVVDKCADPIGSICLSRREALPNLCNVEMEIGIISRFP